MSVMRMNEGCVIFEMLKIKVPHIFNHCYNYLSCSFGHVKPRKPWCSANILANEYNNFTASLVFRKQTERRICAEISPRMNISERIKANFYANPKRKKLTEFQNLFFMFIFSSLHQHIIFYSLDLHQDNS